MKKYALILLTASTILVSCKSDKTKNPENTTTKAPETTEHNHSTEGQEIPAEVITNPTTMEIDRKEHDFGKIADNKNVETEFTITNTGEDDLLISSAQGSCGCTVPEFPKEPIPPGESRPMKVSFNPAGKEGPQLKTVTISANTSPATTVINIKSDVQKTAQ